jgi:hypothetical protein
MANMAVFVKGTPIPVGILAEFSLSFDLYTAMPYGQMVVTDRMQEHYKNFHVGAPVDITIIDSSGSAIYEAQLGVISSTKKSSSDGVTLDTYAVELIDYWYFTQKAMTSSYFGSVGQVILETLRKDGFNKNLNINPTSDLPRLRYQLATTSFQFISKLSQYAVSDNSAVFFYKNMKGQLSLSSVKSLISHNPSWKVTLASGVVKWSDQQKSPILTVHSWASQGTVDSSKSRYFIEPSLAHIVEKKTQPQSIVIEDDFAQEFPELKILPPITYYGTVDKATGDFIAEQINQIEKNNQDAQQIYFISTDFVENALDLGSYISAQPLSTDDGGLVESGRYLVNHVDLLLTKEKLITAKVLMTRKEPLIT